MNYAKLQVAVSRQHVSVMGQKVHFVDFGSLRQLFTELFVNRLYDVSLHSDSPTIVDCGSNIGMSAMYFKRRYPNARILCFEPHPELYDKLCRNVHPLQMETYPIALGDGDGAVELFLNQGDINTRSLNVSVFRRGASQSISVRCERLSKFLPEQVDLLKLDIEGSEDAVIRDLSESGSLGKIKSVICEYHHHISGPPSRLSCLLSRLEDAGFVYNLWAYTETPPVAHAYQDVLIYANRPPAL